MSASALFEQIKSIFTDVGEDVDYDPYNLADEIGEEEETTTIAPVKRKPSVVSINNRGYEVNVVSPKSFDESLTIAKSLIEKRTVVLNLELVDHEQSQRIVDFLAGTTYALSGHQQQIGEGVFIFTPNNVNISAEQEKKTSASIADAFWNQVK